METGATPMFVHKLRTFSNHPLFIETMTDRTAAALEQIPEERRAQAALVFTAHSIPVAMAQTSAYERQLREAAGLIAARVAKPSGPSPIRAAADHHRSLGWNRISSNRCVVNVRAMWL